MIILINERLFIDLIVIWWNFINNNKLIRIRYWNFIFVYVYSICLILFMLIY